MSSNVESRIAILSDLHLGKNMFVDKIGDRNAIEKVIELRQKEIELFELKQRFYESALHKLFSEV